MSDSFVVVLMSESSPVNVTEEPNNEIVSIKTRGDERKVLIISL